MNVGRVIRIYRANAAHLRGRKGRGRDADMDEYFNSKYADIWDAAADILEEEVRQSNRYHQEPT